VVPPIIRAPASLSFPCPFAVLAARAQPMTEASGGVDAVGADADISSRVPTHDEGRDVPCGDDPLVLAVDAAIVLARKARSDAAEARARARVTCAIARDTACRAEEIKSRSADLAECAAIAQDAARRQRAHSMLHHAPALFDQAGAGASLAPCHPRQDLMQGPEPFPKKLRHFLDRIRVSP